MLLQAISQSVYSHKKHIAIVSASDDPSVCFTLLTTHTVSALLQCFGYYGRKGLNDAHHRYLPLAIVMDL